MRVSNKPDNVCDWGSCKETCESYAMEDVEISDGIGRIEKTTFYYRRCGYHGWGGIHLHSISISKEEYIIRQVLDL